MKRNLGLRILLTYRLMKHVMLMNTRSKKYKYLKIVSKLLQNSKIVNRKYCHSGGEDKIIVKRVADLFTLLLV